MRKVRYASTMHAELNDIYVVCERWRRGKPLHMLRPQLRRDQLARLLSLQDRECVVLDGRAFYRGNTLPPMPAGYALAPPARVTAWRVVLFAVLLVIVAVLGARDWLRRV